MYITIVQSSFLIPWVLTTSVHSLKFISSALKTNVVSFIYSSQHQGLLPRSIFTKSKSLHCRMVASSNINLMKNSTVSNACEESAGYSSVYWFRNALRLHDNPSLLEACLKSKALVPLVIIDPKMPFAQTPNVKPGKIRTKFILQSLQNLNQKLQDIDRRLLVLKGEPDQVLPALFDILKGEQITHLFYEKDSAAPLRRQDQNTLQRLPKHLTVKSFDTHTLFEMEKYLARCPGHVAPSTFGGFTKIFHQLGTIPTPVETITYLPPLPQHLSAILIQSSIERYQGEAAESDAFPIPTLTELGYSDEQNSSYPGENEIFLGGETEALQRLHLIVTNRKQWVAKFEKPKTSPNALQPDTTGLSPYIKHGCLSARKVYHELQRIYDLYPDQHSKPPVSLHGQLMWREYNTLMGYTTPNFDRMIGNPVARQIPWDNDPMLLDAWKNSQTGYPFIDAIMAQLKHTGWIHHLARHAVACFLTRGDLWQSWEHGALYFEEALIDADWSINNFNWQWLSCTAHFYQYFRCYSPVAFGKKTDPQGNYIRKWLPLFHNFPTQYIYEPWKAPQSVQLKTGVIIGKTYPPPLVEHTSVSKANMSRMKQAYDAANNNNVLVANAREASDTSTENVPPSSAARVRKQSLTTTGSDSTGKRPKKEK